MHKNIETSTTLFRLAYKNAYDSPNTWIVLGYATYGNWGCN